MNDTNERGAKWLEAERLIAEQEAEPIERDPYEDMVDCYDDEEDSGMRNEDFL